MKRILLVIITLMISIQGYAQKQGINYQAVILNPNAQEIPGVDAEGNLLANTIVGIQFTIKQELSEGQHARLFAHKSENGQIQ